MKGLFSALGFFTILPIPAKYASLPVSDTLKWFPAAGLILGCLWAGLDFLIGQFFSANLRGFLDVLVLVVLTGGLHLDGLADTADGLLSHRSREQKLRIMKDSRIGSWGVLALIAILGLKALSIGELVETDRVYLYLAIIPVYGRLSMFAGSRLMPYGRGEDGLGFGLYGDGRHLDWLAAFFAAALLSLLLGWPDFLIVNSCFLVTLTGMISWYKKSIGAVTGDMLGAMGEVVETVLLLSLAAL